MSNNYPTVYGNCDAGCRRRVVPYEEFELSASHIAQPIDENGNYVLELGKTYKIFSDKNGSNNFTCNLAIKYLTSIQGEKVGNIVIPLTVDKYTSYFTFRLEETSCQAYAVFVYFKINGELNYATFETTSSREGGVESCDDYVVLSDASNCLLYNEDASIVAKDGKDGADGQNGKSAYEVAVDNGFEGTEQEWLDSLKAEIVVDQEYNPESENAQSGLAIAEAIANTLGIVETALDAIIAEQNSYIGGDTQ